MLTRNIGKSLFHFLSAVFLLRCILSYSMGPGARPEIHPVTALRNQAIKYQVSISLKAYKYFRQKLKEI